MKLWPFLIPIIGSTFTSTMANLGVSEPVTSTMAFLCGTIFGGIIMHLKYTGAPSSTVR